MWLKRVWLYAPSLMVMYRLMRASAMHLPASPRPRLRLCLCVSLRPAWARVQCLTALGTAAALCCRASSWPSPRCYCHGDITVSIPWHCDKETAANATSLHPFNPSLLSFSLSILTNRSLHLWLNMYVLIHRRSPALLFHPSLFLSL